MPTVCTLGCAMGCAQLQRVADALLKVFWGSHALFGLMMRPKADAGASWYTLLCFPQSGFLFVIFLVRKALLNPCTLRSVSPPILPSISSSCPAHYLPDEPKGVVKIFALESEFPTAFCRNSPSCPKKIRSSIISFFSQKLREHDSQGAVLMQEALFLLLPSLPYQLTSLLPVSHT